MARVISSDGAGPTGLASSVLGGGVTAFTRIISINASHAAWERESAFAKIVRKQQASAYFRFSWKAPGGPSNAASVPGFR
jgi:hypothetical protein